MKALHQQVIQLADAVRTHFAEVAAALEPAKALRAQTAELAQILEAGTELQAQILRVVESVWGHRSGEWCERALKATCLAAASTAIDPGCKTALASLCGSLCSRFVRD